VVECTGTNSNGKALVRESTKQGNDKVARQMEAAHRTSLAKGEVGLRDRKVIPTLQQFCTERVEAWAKARSSWLPLRYEAVARI
jgi:hypothetical protein